MPRAGTPPRPWTGATDPATWDAPLAGTRRIYLLLPEDTALPGGFLERAGDAGAQRVVLHSNRGADLMGVPRLQDAEAQVRRSGSGWTIVRPDWFAQNFETFFRDSVLAGRLCVPVGSARQGFVDADDIAAVAARALTTPRSFQEDVADAAARGVWR